MKNYDCKECNKEFESLESLDAHNIHKHPERVKKRFLFQKKKIKKWLIFVLILILIIWGITSFSNQKVLPPIDIKDHIESYPSEKIVRTPLVLAVQKHILEHVPSGRPGVVINYDCFTYQCEENLVPNLEQFGKKYDFVYVAPFKNMKNKIVLTRYGKLKALDNYVEIVIEEFINY